MGVDVVALSTAINAKVRRAFAIAFLLLDKCCRAFGHENQMYIYRLSPRARERSGMRVISLSALESCFCFTYLGSWVTVRGETYVYR